MQTKALAAFVCIGRITHTAASDTKKSPGPLPFEATRPGDLQRTEN
jgi:hypothetical protein